MLKRLVAVCFCAITFQSAPGGRVKMVENRVPEPIPPPRPEAPDPRLLDSALASLANLSDAHDRPLKWIVGRRIDRFHATLFPIRAVTSSGKCVEAYYKAFRSPEGSHPDLGAIWSRMTLAGLARGEEISERLAALSAQEHISPARVLAVDPQKFAVVTLAVQGRPLGRTVWRLATRRRRAAALAIYRRVGRAIRLIEEASGAWVEQERFQLERVLRRLDRRGHEILTRREVATLRARFEGLYEQALSSSETVVYAHGDLDGTNILVASQGIGLIDFMWPVRFRGYDLAHFVHRMNYEIPKVPSWTSLLAESLFEGYGDASVRSRASWEFTTLERLLVTTTQRVRSSGLNRWLTARALSDLKARLG